MAEFDNYLPCEQYHSAPANEKYPGFTSWFDEEANSWYFGVVTNRGRVVLRSEAYTTESARDNGIESVNRNRDNEQRYAVVQESDGKWYLILKAGNHQEIARSCPHDTEAAAKADIAMCASDAREQSSGVVEDYLACEAYKGHAADARYAGFHTFSDADSGSHYFALLDKKGEVLLRSEAYTTPSSRDNGIESVNRNRDNERRYAVVQEADGAWYLILKAGNHQEIARSCSYTDEAAARAAIALCHSQHGHSAAVVEDYLPCADYIGHTFSSEHPGFTIFSRPEDGQHYFAMLDGHGSVLLRSEGYTTPGARDKGIESVLRNRDIESHYFVAEDDGLWYLALKAGNHQEIARSCGMASSDAAGALMMHCFSRQALEKIATGEGEITEDYLPCPAYEHKAASEFEGFTIFQEPESKLHYFAMLGDDGKVALKSEGYKDPTRRDNGIESVIRNRGIKDHWREMEDERGHYMSLRAVNHQEIARSCTYSDKGAMLAWFTPFLEAHANWDNDAEPEEASGIPAPLAAGAITTATAGAAAALAGAEATPVKTELPPVVPPPVMTTAHDAAPVATTSGNDWWKWLLAGLLLLGLLWLLMRGCDGCNGTKVPPPPPPPASSTAPTTPTPAESTAPAPKPAMCNCSEASDPVFNLPSGTPKSLHKLGTNPEFGDSHGLSPEEFYNKLQTRYKGNADDRRFLDRMAKAMGYKNGFSDIGAQHFSAVTLPAGTEGNIGYSKQHKTLYARLDTEGKDLMAFKIHAENGCDLHFMKTCGNHFFFCSK